MTKSKSEHTQGHTRPLWDSLVSFSISFALVLVPTVLYFCYRDGKAITPMVGDSSEYVVASQADADATPKKVARIIFDAVPSSHIEDALAKLEKVSVVVFRKYSATQLKEMRHRIKGWLEHTSAVSFAIRDSEVPSTFLDSALAYRSLEYLGLDGCTLIDDVSTEEVKSPSPPVRTESVQSLRAENTDMRLFRFNQLRNFDGVLEVNLTKCQLGPNTLWTRGSEPSELRVIYGAELSGLSEKYAQTVGDESGYRCQLWLE